MSGRMIGQHNEKALLRRAEEVMNEKARTSEIFDVEAEQLLPRFKRSELELGKVLGRGGFCVVNEIINFKLEPDSTFNQLLAGNSDGLLIGDEEDEFGELRFGGGILVQDRKFMSQLCLRQKKHARYAIKTLKDECLTDPETFVGGIIDLAVECRFLAVIKHPNIIKMRGCSDGNPLSFGFFVILDRLYATLTQKIAEWKKEDSKSKGFGKIMDMKGKKKHKVWVDRLVVVYNLSSSLEYLHKHGVMYRDLKPDNIGFDVRGDVKLFDFGLAREIPKTGMLTDGTYKLSGNTGSLRYMAPEVAKDEPYNENVDVYSLSIMAWQIFAMDVPFKGYSLAMHNALVVEKGGRPKTDPKWGDKICTWMKKAWSEKIKDRPSMNGCNQVLRDEISLVMVDVEDSQIDVSSRTNNSVKKGN